MKHKPMKHLEISFASVCYLLGLKIKIWLEFMQQNSIYTIKKVWFKNQSDFFRVIVWFWLK